MGQGTLRRVGTTASAGRAGVAALQQAVAAPGRTPIGPVMSGMIPARPTAHLTRSERFTIAIGTPRTVEPVMRAVARPAKTLYSVKGCLRGLRGWIYWGVCLLVGCCPPLSVQIAGPLSF